MSEELKHKIFTTTNCLSAKTMFDYIDNKLSPKERHAVEKHLLDCPLCAEAMEGLELLKNRNRISLINEKINERIASDKKTKIISINYKIIISVAAGLLLLIGSLFFFNQFTKRESDIAELKQNQQSAKPDEKPPTSTPEENKELSGKEKDRAIEIPKPEQTILQNKYTNAEETKPSLGLKNKPASGETSTQHSVNTSGDAVTKDDGDNQTVNIPAQSPSAKSALLEQEKRDVTDKTKIKLGEGTETTNGYYSYNQKPSGAKQNNNEQADELKKSERKISMEADQTSVADENVASAPQTKVANVNQNYKSQISDSRAITDSISVNEIAAFIGGTDSLNNFIKHNFHYPSDNYSWNTSLGSKIIVSFTIDSTGKIVNPHIVQGVNSELNNEALRVASIMPKWKPAIKNNKPVSSVYNLPIQLEIK